MRQKQRVKQSVKQTVVINLEKRRRQPRAKQVSKQHQMYKSLHSPASMQFFPMHQFVPPPNPLSMLTQEQIAQKLDILTIELQKTKMPEIKVKTVPLKEYKDDDDRLKSLQEQPSVVTSPFLQPSSEEMTMASLLKRPPSDPIFQHPQYSAFSPITPPRSAPTTPTEPPAEPVLESKRRSRGRPPGSLNRQKEVIDTEKQQKKVMAQLRGLKKQHKRSQSVE